jgi:type II secretory pathway predicted ATPase ExeA
MYEQCFNLHSRPFTATPFVKHYFAAQSMQQSLANARQAIDRGAGPVVVIGGTGTGKSLLMAMLEEQYRSQFGVVNLACARLDDRLELLQNILFELQLPYSGMSEGELRLSLMDFLKPSEACASGILLLVDEAHMLPVELLDEVRLITNYVKDGQPRVRLVMAGNQRLEDNMANPKLESFNQRIASRCYLTKMSQQETADYVATHIDRAGGDGRQIFAESSLRKIHELSDGCPRFVNQICEQAMILASTRGLSVMDERIVDDAWRDVQNLPASDAEETFSSGALADNENWTVIEFGNLSDDDDVEQETNPVEATKTPDESEENSHEANDDWHEKVESLKSEEIQVAKVADDPSSDLAGVLPAEDVFEATDEQELSADAESISTHEVTADQDEKESQPVADGLGAARNESTQVTGAPVDDPFAEEFANEEEVFDQYAPLVAAQNQSSLAVTSEDIELIHPVLDSEPAPGASAVGTAQVDANDNSMAAPEFDAEESVDRESQPTPESEYHQHVTEASTFEIERQAEEILNSISLGSSAVSQETTNDHDSLSIRSDEELATPTIEFSQAEVETSHDETLEEGILESQRMLQQIIEENNRGAVSAFADTEFSTAENEEVGHSNRESTAGGIVGNVESLAQSNDSTDDKDMIIVSRKDEVDEPSPETSSAEPIPFPATAVSTGKAERMDYQQLFEQLRNMSDD